MQNKLHTTVDTQRVELCEQLYIKKSWCEAKQFFIDLAKQEKFIVVADADYELQSPQQILEQN